MYFKIVGFEGSSKPPMTWGAAALCEYNDSEKIFVNAVTGAKMNYEKFNSYVEEDTVCMVPEVSIQNILPAFVLRVNLNYPVDHVFKIKNSETTYAYCESESDLFIYFLSLNHFDSAVSSVVSEIIFDIKNKIQTSKDSDIIQNLISAGLILDGKNEELFNLLLSTQTVLY